MNQLELIKDFTERFNTYNDSIKNLRKNDSMVDNLDMFLKEIYKNFPEGTVKYLGYSEITDVDTINSLNISDESKKAKNNKKKIIELDSKETFAKLFSFKFKLTSIKIINDESGEQRKEETKIVEMPLWIPICLDGCFYYIRGVKYSAPIQIIDALYFSKPNIVILKFVNRVAQMIRKSKTIQDIRKKPELKWSVDCFYLNLHKEVPLLLYYLANANIYKVINFFGFKGYIKVVELTKEEESNLKLLPEDKLYFRFGMLPMCLEVDRATFENNIKLRQFTASLIIVGKGRLTKESLESRSKWLTQLATSTSKDYQSEIRGKQVLNTFINIYDNKTKLIVKKFTRDGDNIQDMFALCRWAFFNFNKLSSKEINNLNTKRLRYAEYLVHPVIEALTNKVNRYKNLPTGNKTLDKLHDVFKLNRHIIIYSMNSSSQATAIKISQYSDRTNDSIYSSIAKVTAKGNGTPNNKNKFTSSKHKEFNDTQVGNLSLNFGGGELGLDFVLCPEVDIDLDKMCFKNCSTPLGHL